MSSLLMAHGHADARHYPVPMLWTETRIVRQRINRAVATDAVMNQMAIATAHSTKAHKVFQKQIKKLNGTK